jgi:hypothetical protein
VRTTWEVSGRGYKGWVNHNGVAILRIDWRALHDEAWKDAQVKLLGGLDGDGAGAFKREYDLDFTTRAGKPFYPRFAVNAERHAFRMKRTEAGELMLGPTPLLVGWDFGQTAALEVGQFSRDFGGGTLALVHELAWWLVDDLDAPNVRDLARYALGLISLEQLQQLGRQGALRWLVEWEQRRQGAIERGRTPGYPLPWFKYPNAHVTKYGIQHFCGHESRATTALAKKEDSTWQLVLEQAGMYVPGEAFAKQDRYTLVRSLMDVSPESGRPRLLVDEIGCPVLFKGLAGELKHARKGTAAQKGWPDPNSKFNHAHDAAGYIVCGINAVGLVAAQQAQQLAFAERGAGSGQPEIIGPHDDLPWAEVRVPWDERPL